MSEPLHDNDGINKAINAVRGLRNPPAITGRRAKINYAPSPNPANDAEQQFLREYFGFPDNVVVVVMDPNEIPYPQPDPEAEVATEPPPQVQQIAPVAEPEPEPAMTEQQRVEVAEIARQEAEAVALRVAEETRQREIQETKLRNLKKARRKLKKQRGG
jgi:hypothetical protein